MSGKMQLLKVIILGDSGVGKTSLMNQYVQKKFDNRYKATIGAEFLSKEINIDGQDVKVQIWDTAGQERFQSLGSAFYRGADACILVFDVTSMESFSHLTSWMEEFNIQAGKRDCVLIGNKVDLSDKRSVTSRTAQAWCQKHDEGIKYFETSAKDNSGVEEAFLAVAAAALKKKAGSVEEDVPVPTVSLKETSKKKKKDDGCAC
jgi:Ras-related protein Rab-7A